MTTQDNMFTPDDGVTTASDRVVVQDTTGESQVIIEDDLPDHALEMLFRLNSDSVPSGVLRYDRESNRWIHFDE